jgi:hypothetical protein
LLGSKAMRLKGEMMEGMGEAGAEAIMGAC